MSKKMQLSKLSKEAAVSRRAFVAGSAVVGLGLAAGKVGIVKAQEAVEEVKMTPGTYSVEANGCYGPYTVEVEVTGSSIADVRVVGTHESMYMGQRAQATIAANVVGHQTVNVDSIAGATISTTTMKEAIREALSQAGATEDMFADDATTPAPEACNVNSRTKLPYTGGQPRHRRRTPCTRPR